MEWWPMLMALVAGALGIYYYCFRNLDYFKRKNLPHIKPLPALGNMAPLVFARKPMADLINDLYNTSREAKYTGFFDFMTPVVVLRDPDLIKTVCVKNFENFVNHRVFIDEKQDPLFGKNLFSLTDERWRDVRNLLSPAFTSSKMKGMFKLMSDCAVSFAKFLADLPEEKKTMEMKDAFTRYTNDVIATCAFGITVDSMRYPKNEFYIMGRDATNFNFVRSLIFFFSRSFPRFSRLIGLKFVTNKVGKFFKDLISTTIRTRDEKNISRPDMLQLMMESRGKRGEGRELSVEDMTAQAFIFFFGGFDTTSTAMCFTAHELAVNPDVQEKLQKEIDGILEETNGELTYDAINKMDYLEAVINEALRMYPVGVSLDRMCTKTFELPPALPGMEPYTVKKGDVIWIPVYGIHHDPDYFPDPKKFNPDRFLDKNSINNAAFIPFGMGPRMCIGNRFALLEIKVLLFQLLARCNLKPCSKTSIPMELTRKGLQMTAAKGFWMKVEPRSNVSETLTKPAQSNGTTNGILNH